jgi:hypothetical protein
MVRRVIRCAAEVHRYRRIADTDGTRRLPLTATTDFLAADIFKPGRRAAPHQFTRAEGPQHQKSPGIVLWQAAHHRQRHDGGGKLCVSPDGTP